MINIENELRSYLENASKPIQEVLMISQVAHPIWDDSLAILQLANKQMLQPSGIFASEHILAYIGVHSKNIITGKRDSIGFLVTNFRVLTQTEVSLFGKIPSSRISLFCQNQIPRELSNKLWGDFFIKNSLTIGQETLPALKTALEDVVNIVLPQLQEINYLPQEVQKATDIHELIKDLGLINVLNTYAQDEKRFKKFADKHNVIDVISGTVDKPLFGGIYGLVITKTGITSRDLMEDSVTSSWAEIKEYPATLDQQKDAIFAGRQSHIVPAYQKKHIPSIIELINLLAKGEVSI